MADPAIGRLWLMTLVRLAGLLLVLGGLWATARRPFGEPAWLWAGLLLFAGAALVLLVPRWLARRWRS